MTTPEVDRSRAWMRAGRLLIVAVLLLVVVFVALQVPFVISIASVAAIGFGGGWLLDPKRTWWGPEPARILNDAERRAAYRRRELPFLALAFIFIAVVLPFVLAWSGFFD